MHQAPSVPEKTERKTKRPGALGKLDSIWEGLAEATQFLEKEQNRDERQHQAEIERERQKITRVRGIIGAVLGGSTAQAEGGFKKFCKVISNSPSASDDDLKFLQGVGFPVTLRKERFILDAEKVD